jgi:hypothetical protein
MAKIDSFRAFLAGGGARPSQFQVDIIFPKYVTVPVSGAAVQFLVKAASLPASIVAPIDVPFRGRITKIAGERQFANWNVTILNDNDFNIRNALEQWSNGMLNHTATNGIVKPLDYSTDLYVTQLDRNDNPIKKYKFVNCYPQQIGEIGLDFGNVSQIEEYPVEFSVDYWEVISSDVAITQ